MQGFFKKIISKFIFDLLIENEKFSEIIAAHCKNFYLNGSLKTYRVWGEQSKIHLGDNVHLNNAIFNTVSGSIYIGDSSFFGHSVSVLTGTHDVSQLNAARQVAVPSEGRDVVIGKSVWIASNAIIIGPCRIGDNSVVGVGSVVIGDIEPNSFYAGVPAKLIKKIKF